MTKAPALRVICLSVAALTLLSGCENMKKTWDGMKWPNFSGTAKKAPAQPANCPEVGTMPELDRATQIRDNQVLNETVLESITPSCKLENNQAIVRLALAFKGKLGPAGVKEMGKEATYSLPYLVAVVNPQGAIISKDVFAINLTYNGGKTDTSYKDLLEQVIPMGQQEKATDYKILVGFQLDEEQLDYNRKMAASAKPPSMPTK